MNILFLTMSSGLKDISTTGIYTDLMRKFRDNGHNVYIVYPNERRHSIPTIMSQRNGIHTLGVRTLNVTKTNIIEKGVGQLLIETQFKYALKKYYKGIMFDLILYSTPPITFNNVIRYAKKTSNGKSLTYLMLKDIFPQNAIDLGILKKTGFKGILYKLFRRKEKALYALSNYIGCMSPANVQYLLKHNPEISASVVEIAPNSYDVPIFSTNIDLNIRDDIRRKYNLPTDKPIFLYGGNMGKPQCIPFLIECMKAVKDRTDCHFLIVGSGTEYYKLESFINDDTPKSISLFQRLPKEDYDKLTSVCDVGMIFLDYRFTIPNYPSRLLPYLMNKKPIIAVTDPNCDIGIIAESNCYGFYTPSNSVNAFVHTVDKMLSSNMVQMGENGYNFYLKNYTTDHTYNTIIKHLQ